jgi:hypothetical protein
MTLRVLSKDDLAFFHDNGYLVVPNVVPPENLEAVIAAMWEFAAIDGMVRDDPDTWYPPQRKGGLVHLHQHPAIWDNRQYPRLYEAFADILGTENLWVSMDRTSLKPPIDPRFPDYDDRGFTHWDLDTSKPCPRGSACRACSPSRTRTKTWAASSASPASTRTWPSGLPTSPRPQPARARPEPPARRHEGDAHPDEGRRFGHLGPAARPRQRAQRGHAPAPGPVHHDVSASDDEEARQERIACWRERRAPSYWEKDIPERYKGREREMVPEPAPLTPLGRKLLGLDPW